MAPRIPSLLALRLRLAQASGRLDRAGVLVAAALIGVGGAFVAWGFAHAVHGLQLVLLGASGVPETIAAGLPWWQRLLTPAAGGLVAGLLLILGMRLARGQSSTDYMEAVVLGDGVIRSRPTLAKSASSLASIASGGSIGREGSLVQLGAWVASLGARIAGLPPARRRLLTACGAAAGIAAAYNAPLAAAIFVGEIVLASIAIESIAPLLVASVTASAVSRWLLPNAPILGAQEVGLSAPGELIAYLPLGILAGVAATGLLAVLEWSRRGFARLPLPLPARLALGGLVVGALSLAVPQVWGNGAAAISGLLREPAAPLALLVLLLAKVTATAATTGSGAVGGVFTPTLLAGAALGGLYGAGAHALAPEWVPSATPYALVGMAALLAGAAHAPLMAVVMAFEMTLDYHAMLPLMLTCALAWAVSAGLRATPLYDLGGKKRAREDRPASARTVAPLVHADAPSVPLSAPFSTVVRELLAARWNHLYVVDAAGALRGAIALHDVKLHLAEDGLDALVLAADLMGPIAAVTPETSLAQAIEALSRHHGERLPVVETGSGRLLGYLHKLDLHLSFAEASASSQVTAEGKVG